MTHPDDEISICAWIRHLRQSGADVHMCWTHSTPTREAESRRVAQMLGVPQENLIFMGATDGSVCDELASLLPRFKSSMDAIQPDRVACGAFEQGHLDHDSTNYLVNRSFSGRVLEIPFYYSYARYLQIFNRFTDTTEQEVWELSRESAKLKIDIAKQFTSQNIWSLLLWYDRAHRLGARHRRLLNAERMRWQTHQDFRTPNHPSTLARRIAMTTTWARWVQAVKRAEGEDDGLPTIKAPAIKSRRQPAP